MKNLDFQRLNKQSKGSKSEKFSWPVRPNHGGAFLDTEHIQPPQVKILCYAPANGITIVRFLQDKGDFDFIKENHSYKLIIITRLSMLSNVRCSQKSQTTNYCFSV